MEEYNSLEAPRIQCEQLLKELLRALEMSSKFSFKNDTEQAKYAKALSIFIGQYKDLDHAYIKLKGKEKQMQLEEIQKALKCPKDSRNNFGEYNYRTASAILEKVKELTNKPVLLSDELILVGDRYYVKATATYGEYSVTACARETLTRKKMDDAQVTGAASTYARKYALSGLFAIDDSRDDPDTKDNSEEEKAERKKLESTKAAMTDGELASTIKALLQQKTIEGLNKIKHDVKKQYDISKEQLTRLGAEYNTQIEKIKAKGE